MREKPMKTKELRGILAESLRMCLNGDLGVAEASSISKLAHQMTSNLRIEIRACESSLVIPSNAKRMDCIGDLDLS